MRFNENLDITIVKCVKYCSAHVSPHGKNQECFEKAVVMFKRECDLDTDVQVSWKTIYDRFNRLIAERKETNQTNELTSGNVEGCPSSLDHELDSMIQDIDHFEEGKKKK